MATIRDCVKARLDGPYIVIANNCERDFILRYVEVRYYTTGLTQQLLRDAEEAKRLRRIVTERIKVNEPVTSGGEKRIYFGVTENIESLVIAVKLDEEEYRFELPARQ